MFEHPLYEGNLWARAQSGRVSCSELYRIAYWHGSQRSGSYRAVAFQIAQSQNCAMRTASTPPRKRILAAGPALGSTGRLTGYSEVEATLRAIQAFHPKNPV